MILSGLHRRHIMLLAIYHEETKNEYYDRNENYQR